jgi:hypothetical protein
VGSAFRGLVRRWGRFFFRVRHRGVADRERGPDRCHASGAGVDVCSDAPAGHNRLNARRMALLNTLHEPSLCRHVHRELLRSVLLDLTPIISATTCHQRNYVERYSRSSTAWRK